MENKQQTVESEGSSICSDLDQLNLADFGLDEDFVANSNFAFGEFVATENDGTDGEIEKMKTELVKMKKEIESMKLASNINSDEIVNKLDGKIDRLEKYMNDQFQKLAQENQKQGKKDGKDDEQKLEEIKEVEQQNEIGQLEMLKEEGCHQLKSYETELMEMVKYKEMSKRLSRMFEHAIPMMPKKHQSSVEAALQRATNLKPEELQYLLDIKKNELARMEKSDEAMHFPTQKKKEDEEEKLAKMEEEMAKLEEKIDQKDEQLEENYGEICTLNEENSYLKRKLEEKEAKIELLEEKIDQKNEKLAEKDEEICALEEEIDGFKKEIGQKDQKLAEQEGKIGALENEIAEFKEKMALEQQSTIKDFANLKMWDGQQLLPPFDSTNSFNTKSTKAPNSAENVNKTEQKKAYPNVFGYCAGCEQGFLQTDWARQIGDLQYHVGCFECDHCHRQLLTGEEFSQDSKIQRHNRPLGKMVPRILCKKDYMDLVIQKKPTQSANATKVNNTGTKNAFYGCKWQID